MSQQSRDNPVKSEEDQLPELERLRARSELLAARPLQGLRVVMVVENLPVPFDRRVWIEARTLAAAGAEVSVICPTGKGHDARRERLDGIEIYRHALPIEANGALGFALEYGSALLMESWLTARIYFSRGIDVIHGCNPPDLIFLVAMLFRPFGVKYLFDHHDINPELYEAKFNKRGFFWKLMRFFERRTFKAAQISIATNESYKAIAVERGDMRPDDVYVVRSGPDLSRVKPVDPVPEWKAGRRYMVGYVGVMGEQEGIDLLLQSIRYIVHDLDRHDIHFCLVGGGPALDDLKNMAYGLKVNDYVTFTGRAPDNDLFEVLSTSDICVNPDRVNRMNDLSTMNKIMEYMAMGKAMVQFEVKEGRVSAGEASLYAAANDPVDLAEKMLALLADPEKCEEMAAYGKKRVHDELSWDYQIPNLIAAYQRLMPISGKG